MPLIKMPSVSCTALKCFSTISHKRHDFQKKIVGHVIWAVIFSITSVRNNSHSKTKWAKYDQKCALVINKELVNSCPILMKPEFSLQIYEKYSNTKIP